MWTLATTSLGKRQKVKTYFLPGYIAKKGRRSLPFFGENPTKNQRGL
jgi:hypothetical protein